MIATFDPFHHVDGEGKQAGCIPMDVYRKGDQLHLEFDLPGVDPSAVEVTAERDLIRVRAERNWDEEGVEALCCERPQGTFIREFRVGEDFELDKLIAVYRNGVLRLTLPVVEAAKTRRIQVRAALPVAGAEITIGEKRVTEPERVAAPAAA